MILEHPVKAEQYPPSFFKKINERRAKVEKMLMDKYLEKVSTNGKAKQNLRRSNDNPPKKFKSNSGEAVARKVNIFFFA